MKTMVIKVSLDADAYDLIKGKKDSEKRDCFVALNPDAQIPYEQKGPVQQEFAKKQIRKGMLVKTRVDNGWSVMIGNSVLDSDLFFFVNVM